jgi:arylsulfatase A-like enzyme
MDKSLGDIMNYLDKNNIAENTLIIFMSDNGGLTDVQRGKPRNQHNAPLRSGKTSGYEGGLRVPMIVRWPGKIKASGVNTNNVIIEDLFTTILSIAGIKNPSLTQKNDGIDLTNTFKTNKLLQDRYITWHFPHGPNDGRSKDVVPFSAIRLGNWKLMYFHVDEHFELYNTDEDISETTNQLLKEKDIALKLAKELGKRLKENKTPMPVRKSDKKLIAYPDDVIVNALK